MFLNMLLKSDMQLTFFSVADQNSELGIAVMLE